MPDLQRINIRLPAPRYLGRQLHFLTLCFHQRRHYGSNQRLAGWLIYELRKQTAACGFLGHAHCVMPDHLHFLTAGSSESSNLLKLVMRFKQITGSDFAREKNRILWQFKFYDHILRGEDSADRVAWYIWSNPVRAGLCPTPTDYPFLGSFTQMGARLLMGAAPQQWTPPWKDATPLEHASAKMPS